MKTMKKFSSLFLALLLMAGMCSVPAFAAETGCKNVLGDTVYSFDGASLADYGTIYQGTETPVDPAAYTGDEVKIVPESDGSSNNVLKMTQTSSSYGVLFRTWGSGAVKSNLNVAFDIKKSGTDTEPFNLSFYQGKVYLHVLSMKNSTIYLNNTAVYTYDLDVWYNIDLKLNLDIDNDTSTVAGHYARLSITKSGESTPTVIDLPYEDSYRTGTNDRCIADRIYFGWFSKAADGGTVMIDNYMQKELEAPIAPSMDSHDDSFDSLPPINPNLNGDWKQSTVATRTGWTFVKPDAGTYVTTEIEDGKLKLSTTDGGKYSEIVKQPFDSAPNVRHRISLKMNGYDSNKETERSVMLRFASADTSNHTGSTSLMRSFIHFQDGWLKFYNMGGAADRIRLIPDPDFMYPIEFVYDAGAKVCVATVTDQYGVQHEVDLKEKIQGFMDTLRADGTTDGAWHNLNAVGIYFPSGSGNAVCYLDDFNWDIFNDEAMTAASAVKYTGNDGSPLDETVTFDFDRPISKSAAKNVAVAVNGEPVTTPYTTQVGEGKLTVKFSDLDLNTPYTVTVSGVTPMESDVTQAETTYIKEFTTVDAAAGISATTPAKAANTISSTITSYYAEGRPAMLIAALYKDKKLVRIVKQPLDKATSRTGETISLTVEGSDYDEIRSFVWSGFEQLLPYSGALQQ